MRQDLEVLTCSEKEAVTFYLILAVHSCLQFNRSVKFLVKMWVLLACPLMVKAVDKLLGVITCEVLKWYYKNGHGVVQSLGSYYSRDWSQEVVLTQNKHIGSNPNRCTGQGL